MIQWSRIRKVNRKVQYKISYPKGRTVHEHAKYAILALEKNIHVLSECTSTTMAEGVALVRAADKSSAVYMLAEKFENDTLTPFYASDGSEPTIEPCSHHKEWTEESIAEFDALLESIK